MHRFTFQVLLAIGLLFAGGIPILLSFLLNLSLLLSLLLLLLLSVPLTLGLGLLLRREVSGLVKLTAAFAERQLEQRCTVGKWALTGELGDALNQMAAQLIDRDRELSRRDRFQCELSRFLRPALATQIAAGERPLVLTGQRRVISVVFIDLVGYNSFAEIAPPNQVVALLQEVMVMTSELIYRHWGTVDKSVGDCMMAVFGAPVAQGDHAERALAAAEDIQRFAQANAPRWQRLYAFPVQLAIGVATGEAVIGDLGSDNRLDYSAVGDVVSVAARLAAMARPGQVLLSHEVAAEAPSGFDFHSLGEQTLFEGRGSLTVLELP